jgi:DNA-binding NarL/FixJ family response regulator
MDLIKDVRLRYPHLPVLVLSMHDESLFAERVPRAGARRCLTKQESASKILPAIRQGLNKQICVSEQMAKRLIGRSVEGRRSASSPVELLSDRDLQIFEMIGSGRTTARIASILHLDAKTADTCRLRIRRILNLRDSTQLMHHASHWMHPQG